jgi:2-amino-4-hydroxy-6-hydroxymethyldihydropteridine diphosphokinase
MRPLFDVVIGLGSNLGDRRAYLVRAARQIQGLGEVARVSAIYETDPVGQPQPSFLNAALRLKTAVALPDLLERLLEVEQTLGRVRRERWGPRVIDLDILWCLGVALRTERLVVPHAELCARAFALVPLLDVAPEASDPENLASYSKIVSSMDTSGVREVPETRHAWLA